MFRFGGGGFGLWGRAAGGLLVALALVAATGGAARGEGRFPDVADDHRRRLDVLFAAEQGWFRGYPDGTFRPDASVADGQLVEVVRRAFPDGLTRAQLADFVVAGVETGAVEVVVGDGRPTAGTSPTRRASGTRTGNGWGLNCGWRVRMGRPPAG